MNEAPTAVSETEALDAYSSTVTAVAQRVLPSVASLRVRRSSRSFDGGAGSGVVITPDGFLVTSAHVVAQAGAATASFIDGSEYELDVVGADPLSDLAVARGTRPLPPAMAQRLGRKAGVEVQEVVAGSPAAAASLRGGDIIVSVGDVAVGKAGDLRRLMVEAQIGSKLGLSILRGGKLMTVEVVPVELA